MPAIPSEHHRKAIESKEIPTLQSDSLKDAMEAMKGVSLQSAMEALTDESTLKYAVDSLTRSYDSGDLSSSAQSHVDFEDFRVIKTIKKLENIDNESSFKEIFSQLPLNIKRIILCLFIMVIFPLLTKVIAPLSLDI